MYLELFDYFVNNHDVPTETELPLNPDLLSAGYDQSSHLVEDNNVLNSRDGSRSTEMGGLTFSYNTIEECQKLARLFINNSESIFKLLKLNDYKPFFYSLLELESVLLQMLNIFSTVLVKNINKDIDNEERKNEKTIMNNTENSIKSELVVKSEIESITNDEQKEYDVEDNSHEEKDKHDDSDSLDNKNNMECMSWIFNEDILCPHGECSKHFTNLNID